MTLYRQDILDLAALETQLANSIRQTNNKSQLIEIDKTLYYAQRIAELRSARLTAMAPDYPDSGTGGGGGTPTPTPTPGDSMPAPNPNGSYAPTGTIVQVDFNLNTPQPDIAGWNSVYNDRQTVNTGGFTSTAGVQTSIYKMGRVNNTSDANGYGEPPNPPGSGVIPDAVLISNHVVIPGYTIDDRIGGLEVSYAYDITFYGSRMEDSEFTQFNIGSASQVLDTSHNTTRGVTFLKIRPSPMGIIYWSWLVAANTPTNGAALAAMVITEYQPA